MLERMIPNLRIVHVDSEGQRKDREDERRAQAAAELLERFRPEAVQRVVADQVVPASRENWSKL